MEFELLHRFRLESARALTGLDQNHPCARVHGHSFQVTLKICGELDHEKGWVMDFNDIQAAAQPLVKLLDHRLLNEVPGLENPTSEILARYIFDHLRPKLPLLRQVRIAETPDTECRYPKGTS